MVETSTDIAAIWFIVFFTAVAIYGAVIKAREIRAQSTRDRVHYTWSK